MPILCLYWERLCDQHRLITVRGILPTVYQGQQSIIIIIIIVYPRLRETMGSVVGRPSWSSNRWGGENVTADGTR
jgi:hypothetical protein